MKKLVNCKFGGRTKVATIITEGKHHILQLYCTQHFQDEYCKKIKGLYDYAAYDVHKGKLICASNDKNGEYVTSLIMRSILSMDEKQSWTCIFVLINADIDPPDAMDELSEISREVNIFIRADYWTAVYKFIDKQ
jgi:hypothetical protein